MDNVILAFEKDVNPKIFQDLPLTAREYLYPDIPDEIANTFLGYEAGVSIDGDFIIIVNVVLLQRQMYDVYHFVS